MNFSSDINEVIRANLNFLVFFYKKIWHSQKAPKAQKVQKAQKHKMRLKNIWAEKSNLFAYLHFCVFCARKENKTENKKMKSLYNVMY